LLLSWREDKTQNSRRPGLGMSIKFTKMTLPGLLDLGADFCGSEGLSFFLQLALRRIHRTLSERGEDVYAVLDLPLLREALKARTRPMQLQQLKAPFLELELRRARVDGVRIMAILVLYYMGRNLLAFVRPGGAAD
jgi:hypothetical protein